MGAIMDGGPLWETREDIDAAARAKGLKEPSLFQLERWRRVNLLPPARQLPNYKAAMSNIRREPRGKRCGSWNYCVSVTLHQIVRLLFSFFNELRLQGI